MTLDIPTEAITAINGHLILETARAGIHIKTAMYGESSSANHALRKATNHVM